MWRQRFRGNSGCVRTHPTAADDLTATSEPTPEPARTHWRLRVAVDDARGRLAALAMTLSREQASISSVHIHPLPEGGAMDELLLTMPAEADAEDILRAAARADARDAAVWPVDVKAFVDEPTRVLRLAQRVAARPDQLPEALGELLHARVVPVGADVEDRLVVRGPRGDVVLDRPSEPFTPAEQARAEALCAVAGAVADQSTGTQDLADEPARGPAPVALPAPPV